MRIYYNKKETHVKHWCNNIIFQTHTNDKPSKSIAPTFNSKLNLSLSIEHSTLLYNKLMMNTTDANSKTNQQNISTEISTRYPTITKNKALNSLKRALYKTEVSQSKPIIHPHSRNNNNQQTNLCLMDSRVESLFQFNSKIKQERIQRINNTIATDIFNQKKSINKTAIESIKVNKENHLTTHDLLSSFMDNYRQYCTHISNEIDKENDKNNNLKLRLNSLKTELDRLKTKKEKLLQSLEYNLQIKHFLLCVKNKTLTCNKFAGSDLVDYLDDIKKHNYIKSDYTVIRPVKIIKAIQRKTLIKKMSLCKNVLVKHQLSVSNFYSPKSNKDLFRNVDEFDRVFSELTEHLALLLNEDDNKNTELVILKKEAGIINNHYTKDIEYIQLMNTTVQLKEEELNQMKNRNRVLKEYRQKLPNTFDESIPNVRKKLYSTYKLIKSACLRCDNHTSQCFNKTSQALNFLEAIESSVNYLIEQHKIFKRDYVNSYKIIKSQIDKENKIKQGSLLRINDEQKTLRKVLKIMKNTSKIYFIPKRKVNKKHHIVKANVANSSTRHGKDRVYQEFINTFTKEL